MARLTEVRQHDPSLPVETQESTLVWPHWPLHIIPDKLMRCEKAKPGIDKGCPIGVPFEFESDLFEGKALFRFKGLRTSLDPNSDQKYFQGKKRLHQVVIQGRFKKNIKVSDVLTGRKFEKPLALVPPPFMERIICRILKRLAPGVVINLSSKQPMVLAPFFSTVQVIRSDPPGLEPDIMSTDGISENILNVGDTIVTSKERKTLFSDQSCDFLFGTEHVYTFENYDDSLDYSTYTMDFRVFRFEMNRTLNGQPMHVMAKSISEGHILWLFEIWHEKLLN